MKPHSPGSTIFRGFQYRYPQSFLDDLAKALGIKWVKCDPTTIDKNKIEVKPLPPPSGKLYYCEAKYNDEEK